MTEGQKQHQAEHFDDLGSPAFEIHRPHGESRFYRYLMEFKLGRAVALLPGGVGGCRVLSLCCGSGMDAEFMGRLGAEVVALDISHGALLRARERAGIYGLSYRLVRGDSERLPFADDSFDVSFVHDGLHHLPDPWIAIAEMARVARRGVIITEPANAAFTKLAIRLRLIPAEEDAGNFVVRFDAPALRHFFGARGFHGFVSTRYLVKYGHPPGRWLRVFDHPMLFELVRNVFELVGVRLLGGLGNKLSVAASRTPVHGYAHGESAYTSSMGVRTVWT